MEKRKNKRFKDISPITKGYVINRLKFDETIPQIAKHFGLGVSTINRIIEERFSIKK